MPPRMPMGPPPGPPPPLPSDLEPQKFGGQQQQQQQQMGPQPPQPPQQASPPPNANWPQPGALPNGSGSAKDMQQKAHQKYTDALRKLQQAEGGPGSPPGPPADYNTTTGGDPEFSRRAAEQNWARTNMMRTRMMPVSNEIRKFLMDFGEKIQ